MALKKSPVLSTYHLFAQNWVRITTEEVIPMARIGNWQFRKTERLSTKPLFFSLLCSFTSRNTKRRGFREYDDSTFPFLLPNLFVFHCYNDGSIQQPASIGKKHNFRFSWSGNHRSYFRILFMKCLRVVVSGAAGLIGYSLSGLLVRFFSKIYP